MLTLEHGPASWCDRGEHRNEFQGCVVEAGGEYRDSSTARVICCIREGFGDVCWLLLTT